MHRALVTAGRVVLWGTVGLLLVRGVVSVLRPAAPPPRRAASAVTGHGFPTEAASAFAARFAHDYLTYDAANPDVRRRQLAEYLSEGADTLAGWDGKGKQVAVNSVPVSVDVRSPTVAVVTVAVEVTGPRWLHLAVPVAADENGLVVLEQPALVPGPRAAEPPAVPDTGSDAKLSVEVRPVLEAFFRAFAGGSESDLAYYMTPGRRLVGLGGTVALDGLTEVVVSDGGTRRSALARVRWVDQTTGGRVTQTYHLLLVQRDQRWYVDRLGAGPAINTKEAA